MWRKALVVATAGAITFYCVVRPPFKAESGQTQQSDRVAVELPAAKSSTPYGRALKLVSDKRAEQEVDERTAISAIQGIRRGAQGALRPDRQVK